MGATYDGYAVVVKRRDPDSPRRLDNQVRAAMGAMTAVGATRAPSGDGAVAAYHARKYAVFARMADDQAAYREMMLAGGDDGGGAGRIRMP